MSAASSKVTEDDMDNNTRQVLRQIEYYFSDANYPKDKFLQAEVAKSEDGWVDISVLAGFNRIKTLVPSQEVSAVADILKLSNHLELSEDGARVRRPGIVKKSVKLGGMEFKSRDEVVSYARQLIAEGDAATDGAIPTEGQEFVKALLDLHDKAAEKRGDGVERIKVGRNPDFPDTSCFVVARVDGSEVDFSYLKCLEKIFPVLGRGAGAGAGAGGKKRAGGGSNDSSSKRPKTEESAPAPVEYESGKIVVLKSLPEGFDRFTLRDKLGGPDAGCNFVEMVRPTRPVRPARPARLPCLPRMPRMPRLPRRHALPTRCPSRGACHHPCYCAPAARRPASPAAARRPASPAALPLPPPLRHRFAAGLAVGSLTSSLHAFATPRGDVISA